MNIVCAVCCFALAAFVLVVMVSARMSEPNEWRAFAQEHGFTVLDQTFWTMQMQGHFAGVHFNVSRRTRRNSTYCTIRTETTVDAPDIRGALWMEQSDPHIGEADFDKLVFLEDESALPLLDADLRERLGAFVREGGGVTEGHLHQRFDAAVINREDMPAHLQRIADLQQALQERAAVPVVDRLCAIATTDPVPNVRERAVEILLRDHPDHPKVRALAGQQPDGP